MNKVKSELCSHSALTDTLPLTRLGQSQVLRAASCLGLARLRLQMSARVARRCFWMGECGGQCWERNRRHQGPLAVFAGRVGCIRQGSCLNAQLRCRGTVFTFHYEEARRCLRLIT